MDFHSRESVPVERIYSRARQHFVDIRKLGEVRMSLERLELLLSFDIAGATSLQCVGACCFFTDNDDFVVFESDLVLVQQLADHRTEHLVPEHLDPSLRFFCGIGSKSQEFKIPVSVDLLTIEAATGMTNEAPVAYRWTDVVSQLRPGPGPCVNGKMPSMRWLHGDLHPKYWAPAVGQPGTKTS